MSVAKKSLCLSLNVMLVGWVLLSCNGIAYSQSINFIRNDLSHTTINSPRTKQQYSKINFRAYSVLLVQDFKEQATTPFALNKKQYINLAAFAALTAGLILADDAVDKSANHINYTNPFIRNSSPVITEFGSKYGIATVGVFALYGIISKNNRAQATAMLATHAMITSGVWTRVGKIITGRERPSASYTNSLEEGGMWHGPASIFQFDDDKKKLAGSNYDAFPSGHTATAFSIATVYAKMYADKPIVPIIAYSAATLVGLSRTTEHTHWISDVVVGAALGYLCGNQVVNNYRKLFFLNSPSRKQNNFSVNINYMHNTIMPDITYKF